MKTKQIILNVPESQEDCDNMESCIECSYYDKYDSYKCESFIEGLDEIE